MDWLWYNHQEANKWDFETLVEHKRSAFQAHAEYAGKDMVTPEAIDLVPLNNEKKAPVLDSESFEANVQPVKYRLNGKGVSKALYGEAKANKSKPIA